MIISGFHFFFYILLTWSWHITDTFLLVSEMCIVFTHLTHIYYTFKSSQGQYFPPAVVGRANSVIDLFKPLLKDSVPNCSPLIGPSRLPLMLTSFRLYLADSVSKLVPIIQPFSVDQNQQWTQFSQPRKLKSHIAFNTPTLNTPRIPENINSTPSYYTQNLHGDFRVAVRYQEWDRLPRQLICLQNMLTM